MFGILWHFFGIFRVTEAAVEHLEWNNADSMRGFVPYGHVPHGSFHLRDSTPLTGGRTHSTLNQVWRNLSRAFMKADEAPDVWRAFYSIGYWHRHEHLIAGVTFRNSMSCFKMKSNESSVCSDWITNATKLMCYWKTLSDVMAIFRSYCKFFAGVKLFLDRVFLVFKPFP